VENDRYKSFLKTVGENIRKKRKEQGITMESLASDANIEYRQLGRIERGEVNTTIISLLRISEVLKVEIGLFFNIK
jgi:transcriptional regulator with XRE-family HTH domain